MDHHGLRVKLNPPTPNGPTVQDAEGALSIPDDIPIRASVWSWDHAEEQWRLFECPVPPWGAGGTLSIPDDIPIQASVWSLDHAEEHSG